jgi:two-component system chemotaxis response regulator CheY
MAGEKVLLIDSSSAVQEIGQAALEEAGFRVIIGSNGVAALTSPDLPDIAAMVLDSTMEGVDGFLAARELKTSADTHKIPILLLIPEEKAEPGGSQNLHGANGYLLKPFNPPALVGRVRALIEERLIRDQCDQFLSDAANAFMERLAEQHIHDAAEKKTQIIVERAIQNVVTQLDQRITREVNERMTSLTVEREQELVRATVHEVAQSMVEKLAERKVSEAIESMLAELTEKNVKKVADSVVQSVARKQIKESLELMLPREMTIQAQKGMEALLPDVTQKIVLTIDGIAQKVVAKAAREKLPELTERHLKATSEKALPDMVRDLVAKELAAHIADQIEPSVRAAANRINRRTLIMTGVAVLVMITAFVALLLLRQRLGL